MPALLLTLIPQLISAGVALAPLLAGLLSTRAKLQTPDPTRPDVDDATMKAVEDAIVTVQKAIDDTAAAAV